MSRQWTIRANFPLQGADLVEVVEAGSWPAAVGAAARAFKQRLKGKQVKALSMTCELTGKSTKPAASQQAEPAQAQLTVEDLEPGPRSQAEQAAEQASPAMPDAPEVDGQS